MTKYVLAVVAPLAVMIGWIAYHLVVVTHGAAVELPIRGYDPRDLLSGHYLLFEIDYGRELCGADDANRRLCVCFDAPDAVPATLGWVGDCVDRPASCGAYLGGYCQGRRFTTGLDRFYIPEEQTAALQRVPENASVVVKLNGRGGGIISTLKVDGKPVL